MLYYSYNIQKNEAMKLMEKAQVNEWKEKLPFIEKVIAGEEVLWLNP